MVTTKVWMKCKDAIDMYLDERNSFFLKNPRRAWNKI